jgi:hypothetical protein
MVRGGRTIRGASLTPTPKAETRVVHARVQQRDTQPSMNKSSTFNY